MLKSLSVRTKLGILVVIPVVAAMIITAIALYNVDKISGNLTRSLHEEGFESVSLVLNADRDFYQALDGMKQLMLDRSGGAGDQEAMDADRAAYEENAAQTAERVGQAVDLLAENQEFWDGIKDETTGMTIMQHYDEFTADFDGWTAISADIAAGKPVSDEWYSLFDSAREHLNMIGELIGIGADESIVANDASKASMIRTIMLIDVATLIIVIALAFLIIRSITVPMSASVAMLQDMIKGRLSRRLHLDQNDEIGIMGRSLDQYAENLQVNVLGAFKRISEGDLDIEISAADPQDEISPVIMATVGNLRALVAEAETLTNAAVEGRLATRGNAEAFSGGYREIVAGVNATLDAVIGPLNVAADYMDRISKGDIPPAITDDYKGDFDLIKNNINTCIGAVNLLVKDMNELSVAAIEGQLSTRADAGRHSGDFAKVAAGVNATLDAVIGPLNVAAGYIDRIGRGEIPEKITDSYNGDFDRIKNDINACIDGLGGLVEGRDILVRMAQNDYTMTVDGAYLGIFSEIADSVNTVGKRINHTIDILSNVAAGDLVDLAELKAVGRRSENDKLVPTLITMMEAIKSLVEEAAMLSSATVEGKLSTRGDASKFKGQYANVVAGVNATLDAVIEPVEEARAVLTEMARGNLQVRVTGDYRGDHAELANALNETIESLVSYVGEISAVLSEMGAGNLQQVITADYKGDFVAIKDALNNIIDSLNEVLGDINEASDQVASGSRQVSDGSQALSQGATEQASSIEELTASITEIASQTKQNAMNANQANELATTAKNNAVKGDSQMREMLNSMADISDSSANISKIIKVIDDIAFQTNILALNAAVEAARAGQHGKGFAVVAEEVRNLAARSANAARETTDLIEGSIGKVQHGTKIAQETAEALNEIVDGVEKAANLVGDIAAASNEQAGGIAQVNKGIEQVSLVVQTNSATAEESAAASEELSGQAELLKQMVGRFRLRKSGGTALGGGEQRLLGGGSGSRPGDAGGGAAETGTGKGSSAKPKIALTDTEFDKY